ncbi:unnamed protein product (macronuclear) [Paramecium tetraurelia]|uniref:Uncharacterized protein n=1 Tax=Paramecium tetraurelia TaxID=5888 RepID=A0E0P9_PARTE|nr:uncharacterized protein GSPATT00022034001 [Paramecium tetraurelia]CAK88866.1 unnamed protein product [Paramecium tetraurelia]|eukprot:XP_001456263.1 hypothetical protein (macronuclear) [Paramecium tetraurelia strain d4-2]
MRQTLLKLREEMDQYMEQIEQKTMNIKMNKVNYMEEINYQMDTLNYYPPYELASRSYLTRLNSRLVPCPNPSAKKVFECNDDQDIEEQTNQVLTSYQHLKLRPQQGLAYSIGDRLPQPMKKIHQKFEEQPAEIENQTQVLCVCFKEFQGESNLAQWQIITGQKENLNFNMRQANDELTNYRSASGDGSLPWEPNSTYSSIIHD